MKAAVVTDFSRPRPDQLDDAADCSVDPHRHPTGDDDVLVSGKLYLAGGEWTGTLAGRALGEPDRGS